MATVDALARYLYVKPQPCWASSPTPAALAHPIGPCTQFTYLNSKSRGDCTQYGQQIDLQMCWAAVAYTPHAGAEPLIGWVAFANTSTAAAPAGDVCGPAVVNAQGVRQIFLGMCDNKECDLTSKPRYWACWGGGSIYYCRLRQILIVCGLCMITAYNDACPAN